MWFHEVKTESLETQRQRKRHVVTDFRIYTVQPLVDLLFIIPVHCYGYTKATVLFHIKRK